MPNNSLILQCFESGKFFIEKKMVQFFPEGTCMYPCIRPGDVLHIQPAEIDDLQVGDVAVYRRCNRLFAHRTVSKEVQDGSPCIVTKPDTCRKGNDGRTFGADILGKVLHVERKGVLLSPAQKDFSFTENIILKGALKIYQMTQSLKLKLIAAVCLIQQTKPYHFVGSFLFKKTKLEFMFQAPLNSKPDCYWFKQITEAEFLKLMKEGSVSELKISVRSHFKPVGFFHFVNERKNNISAWHLTEKNIRIRYRGTALEERIRGQIQDIYAPRGINVSAACEEITQ